MELFLANDPKNILLLGGFPVGFQCIVGTRTSAVAAYLDITVNSYDYFLSQHVFFSDQTKPNNRYLNSASLQEIKYIEPG